MAATKYYGLKQWTQGERPRRAEANETLTKIDTAIHGVKAAGDGNLSTLRRELASEVGALKKTLEQLDGEKCAVSMGTYLGDGADNRTISLGFTPDAVLVEMWHGGRGPDGRTVQGGLALANRPLNSNGGSAVSITANGFKVFMNADNGVYTNMNGNTFYYVAFR